MTDDTLLPFSFPAVRSKKITAAFDGERITSNGGVLLLAAAEERLRLAERLAAVICDPRDPNRLTRAMADILRARIFVIACGYEDTNDLDRLHGDPAFKLACGRLPDSGLDLCSQPTCSRVENLPDLRTVIRLGEVLLDLWLSSYAAPPESVTLDIDDTLDVVHGHQNLSFFNAHYDERCFLPIHIYDAATGRPVAIILRPGKTPTGKEIRGHLCRLVRRIRRRWRTTRVLFRGDSHYGRAEVKKWCEDNGIDYLFGLPGNRVLQRLVDETADDIRTHRALDQKPVLRGFAETRYRAKSWDVERPGLRAYRSDRPRSRHPLRRDQPRERLARAHLRRDLLRPRPGGKPDQDAQEPARLRPHQLPFAARQPGPARPPYRRLLADAHRPRCGA
jgi:hypothetical protein